MFKILPVGTAYTFRAGPFIDITTGLPLPALTITQSDIQISKAGGAFAQTSDAAPVTTYDSMGFYQLPLTVTDTSTLGFLRTAIAMPGSSVVWEDFYIVPLNTYNSLVAGTTSLTTDLNADQSGVTIGTVTTNTDMRGTDGALTDKAGFSLSTAGILAIWHQLTSAITTAGSIGKLVTDFLDATISSRSSHTAGDVDAAVTASHGVGSYVGGGGGGGGDATLANQTTMNGKLDTIISTGGAGPWTTGAGGGGGGDWTTTELNQLRHRLGIDGATATPAANTPNLPVDLNANQAGVTIGTVNAVPATVATQAKQDTLITTTNTINTQVQKIPENIKKNSPLNNFQFVMVLASDHVTGATGLTVTGEVSRNGGAFVALTNSVTEISAGAYKVNLTAADLNADSVMLKFSALTADTRIISIPKLIA